MGLTRRREDAKEEEGLGLTRGREVFGGGEFFGMDLTRRKRRVGFLWGGKFLIWVVGWE